MADAGDSNPMASDGGNNLGREHCVNAVSTAGVAELADAPDSKSGGGNPMRVRFPPSALVVMDPITFRRWRDLTYHDPADKLQEYVATLREVEAAPPPCGRSRPSCAPSSRGCSGR